MTRSFTKASSPEMTEITPTSVATPMTMPSRVSALRSPCARSARSDSRSSSPLGISARARWAAALLGLLELDRVAVLQLAQRLEGSADDGLAALEARHHLHRELAQQSRLDGLEAGLAPLVQVDALLVARRALGRGLARLARDLAHHQGLDGHHHRLAAEAGQHLGLGGQPGLHVRRRGPALDLHPRLAGPR